MDTLTKGLGPVLLTLLRHVARILANGRAAFFESCDAIGWNSCDVSQNVSNTGPSNVKSVSKSRSVGNAVGWGVKNIYMNYLLGYNVHLTHLNINIL